MFLCWLLKVVKPQLEATLFKVYKVESNGLGDVNEPGGFYIHA